CAFFRVTVPLVPIMRSSLPARLTFFQQALPFFYGAASFFRAMPLFF
ncbi:MAG: hypothetical protein AVDCRST_MAG56-6017, partial [uncultured Cytophagales bacterium]